MVLIKTDVKKNRNNYYYNIFYNIFLRKRFLLGYIPYTIFLNEYLYVINAIFR